MQFVHVYILNFHSETGGSVGIQNVHSPRRLNKSSLVGHIVLKSCFILVFTKKAHQSSLVDVEKKYTQ